MGLFSRFKKTPDHEKKVDLAYKCYKPEMVGMIYPGGRTQANGIIRSIARICNIDLESCDAAKYHELLTVYSDVLIRKVVTRHENSEIIISLRVNHGSIITDDCIAKKILAYVSMNMANNDFVINKDADMETINGIACAFTQMEKDTAANASAQNMNLDDPEYGLVVSKPIYVKGINGSDMYLSKLKSSLGENLVWNRRGSTSAAGINGMIDIYDSTLPSGKAYKTIYINMYGSDNSTKIPKGFSK